MAFIASPVKYEVNFINSGETAEVFHEDLERAVIDFFGNYSSENILGITFFDAVYDNDEHLMYQNLLKKCGYENRSVDFFNDLISQLEQADSTRDNPVKMGEVTFPVIFLLPVLEKIIPGIKYMTVRNEAQVQSLANMKVPDAEKDDINRVIEKYPVRFSMHTIRQMRVSKSVAYQYLPFVEELENVGHTNTWIGQFHQGLLEQMYQNRVIFLLNMSCPVYCRFCFRKHKDSRNESNPTPEDVKRAVDHVKSSPAIKEIVITGGDPYLNRANMESAIDGLKEIPHVQTLRLATRSVAYYPDLFLKDNERWLNYLKMKNLELMQMGKRIEVATHFIHPDEVSIQSLYIISELVRAGIAVYVQTPFLKDCNDKGPELVRLFSMLRGAGAELHYIYIPCSPIHGNSVYWAPLSDGINAGIFLRGHLSDRIIPRICTATPIGKMDWNNSGWAVEKDSESDSFIWLRSPYTPEYFNNFAPVANDLEVIRKNEDGTIDVRYMAQIGDDSLFYGSRPPRPDDLKINPFNGRKYDLSKELLDKYKGIGRTIVPLSSSALPGPASSTLARVHKTRVELDISYSETDIEYIRDNRDITDVVLVSKGPDPMLSPGKLRTLAFILKDIQHVNSLRIRSLDLIYRPQTFTHGLLETLGLINSLSISNPLRIDIETWVLHVNELTEFQKKLTRELYKKGITVYFNTPLITGVNDNEHAIHDIAYKSRQYGMQFHHVYVAGLDIQQKLNGEPAVDMYDVIDIATRVRRDGSGREIPAYIVQTEVGEADYGLCTKFCVDNGNVIAELLPYSLAYFKDMSPDFEWPEGVSVSDDGCPVVRVQGLKQSVEFSI